MGIHTVATAGYWSIGQYGVQVQVLEYGYLYHILYIEYIVYVDVEQDGGRITQVHMGCCCNTVPNTPMRISTRMFMSNNRTSRNARGIKRENAPQ